VDIDRRSGATAAAAALALALALGPVAAASGCTSHSDGSSSTSGSSASSDGGAANGTVPGTPLTLAGLESPTNYAFTLFIPSTLVDGGGTTQTTSVYSPSDWETQLGALPVEIHVDGFVYVKLGNAWSKATDSPNSYAQSALPGFAEQFFGMASNPSATVTDAGPCTVAGTSGHTWNVAVKGTTTVLASACVADQGGAMLSSSIGASDPQTFTMTAIGTVARIPVPGPVQ